MTLTGMDYFVVLAQERSFTRAAKSLHITQQSLSAHIASIERELGAQLVYRRTPLELTYAGQTFLRYAREVQQSMDAMRQDLCAISADQKGVLRIGIAATRGRAIMPELIETFQRRFPNITIALLEASNEALQEAAHSGTIDLAIANLPDTVPGLTIREAYREEVVLLLSKQLLAAHSGSDEGAEVDLRRLADCPFVLSDPADIAGRIGQDVLRRAGLRPPVKASSRNMETLLALCLRGVGACFCPEDLVRAVLTEEQRADLHCIRLGDQARYPIRFGYRERSQPWSVLTAFLTMAQEVLRR